MLEHLGIGLVVRPVEVDESPLADEAPDDYVLRLARVKAAVRCEAGELVIAADTCVTLNGDILGKPVDPADARRMLALLAGRTHEVLTGVALARRSNDRVHIESEIARTRVDMRKMTTAEIDWYVDTGECLDKAGAYAIQGLGSLFVSANHGVYSNVVGLPIPVLYRLFERIGLSLLDRVRLEHSVAE